jgi:hypothetical protein
MEFPNNQPENNDGNITFTSSPDSTLQVEKQWYEKDFYVILAFLLFYPVGLFMMWKYSSWKKSAKIILTTFFVIGLLPLLFIWISLASIKVKNTVNPGKANTSQYYTCTQLNAEWSKCKNTQFGFSFEYPAKWNYIDQSGDTLLLGTATNLKDNYIFSVQGYKFGSADGAKSFAQGRGTTAVVNGLTTGTDHKTTSDGGLNWLSTAIDGNTTYTIKTSFGLKVAGTGLSEKELQGIFDHIAGSIKKE